MTLALLAIAFSLLSPSAEAAQDTVGAEIRTLIAQARHPWAGRPDFVRHLDVLARLYASRADAPVWLDGRRLSAAGSEAIAALQAAADDGLTPADYDVMTIENLARGIAHPSWNGVSLARFDLLLSLSLVRYLDDLHAGRVRADPFGRRRASPGLDLAASVAGAVAGDSVGRLVSALTPPFAQYRNLRFHLGRYRRLAADTSFVVLPSDQIIRPGEPYKAVGALKDRLVALGDLAADSATEAGGIYSAAVVNAVRRFQLRHALEPDGVLGLATLAALNVPYAARAEQIALAMERLRTLPPIGRQRFIVVNIPAFQLFAFDSVGGSGAPSLEMKVVTGKALDTRTPLLFEELRYVELRPYWNVPFSILVKEILPLLRRRPGYLRANQMEVVGSRDVVLGDTVTTTIRQGLKTGALRVRQRPGPGNALGLAKFVFPNAANVYMHGTPETELFSLTRRDFSHGCIRVEDAAGLAAWVLQDQPVWSPAALRAAMATTTTTRALLTRPMPVVVFYTTAVAFPNGTVNFYPDVYGHDRDLKEALRAAPEPI